MKIGILTQPIHWNYGGILQNWALQQVLRRLGHEPLKLERKYRNPWPFVRRQPLAIAKTAAMKLIGRRRDVSLRQLYDEILWKCSRLPIGELGIAVSRPLYDAAAVGRAARSVDAFIVGSDQVWREEYSPSIEEFFLSFLDDADPRPRIAYAASFGKPSGAISDARLPRCRVLLQRFDAVSVRESEGRDILARDFDHPDAPVVLDPTLLLTADDYRPIVAQGRRQPHITSYILDSTPGKEAAIDAIASRLRLPADRLAVRYEAGARERSPRVSRWLRAIATADFVVTDSFHGTVFAILFSRPFLAIGNAYRGIDRFRSLLEPLGLADRLILDPAALDADTLGALLRRPVDYAEAHCRLDAERARSLDWLRAALAPNRPSRP